MSETTYQWLQGVFLSQKLHWWFDMEAANSPQPYGEWNLATPMLRSWAHERGLLGSAYLPPGRGIDVPGRATRMQWPEAEAPILWPPDAKSQLFRKDPDAGNDWRQKEKEAAEDEMVGWHHQLNGTWVWASCGRLWRTGKPGMPQTMGSQRVRHNWTTTTMTNNGKESEKYIYVCVYIYICS